MLTKFGREVRKLRIDLALKMIDMADALSVSPAYLSAVETGRKEITKQFADRVVDYFTSLNVDATHLHQLALESRNEVRIDMKGRSDDERQLVAAFARRLGEFDEARRAHLLRLVNGEESNE